MTIDHESNTRMALINERENRRIVRAYTRTLGLTLYRSMDARNAMVSVERQLRADGVIQP